MRSSQGWVKGRYFSETVGADRRQPRSISSKKETRTPDELRLSQIAEFFGVTVEHMRRDHSASDTPAGNPSPDFASGVSPNGGAPNDRENRQTACESRPPDLFFSHCPFYRPPKPGQPLSNNVHSLCWLAERFFGDMREFGITIRLHPDDIDRIVGRVLAGKSL